MRSSGASGQTVASGSEEMTSTAQQRPKGATEQAADDARTGGEEVAEKNNIIEEIARKTDLLALNAAAQISRLTAEGVKTAEGAGQLLTRLVPDTQRTAELVREIAGGERGTEYGRRTSE